MFFGTFLAIFTFIPLSFVSFSAHEIYKGIQSNTWKKTNGKILSIRTIYDNHSTKHSNTKVFYQYASGGKTYTNSKISYLKEFPYIGEEFDTFNLYNSSDSVSVFLNPDTKEESVLIQGTGIFPFFVLLLGVCFSNIFGFWFAIYIDSHKTLTKKISPQKQRSVLFTSFFLPFSSRFADQFFRISKCLHLSFGRKLADNGSNNYRSTRSRSRQKRRTPKYIG